MITLTYTIYADVLFVLNFAVDFICICFSLYVCKLNRKAIPIIISSSIGGIYSILFLFLKENEYFLQLVIHISVLILICAISTPSKDVKTVLKVSAVFFGISGLCGGIITSVFSFAGKYYIFGGGIYADVTFTELIITVALLSISAIPFFVKTKNKINVKTVSVSISFQGRQSNFDALIDSGNLLRDPISNDGILLVKDKKLRDIFTQNQLLAIKELNVLSESFPTGIRLISIQNGLLPIFRPQSTDLKIFGIKGKKGISVLVGIDFSQGSFGGAEGLIPAEYI